MTTSNRRTFLKQSGLAVSAVGLSGSANPLSGAGNPPAALEPTVLRAVGTLVLPSELGSDAREGAIRAFEAWATDYDPVAELNHGYGTSEIRYGPPDPVPGWTAQLAALDLESEKRHGTAFVSLDAGRAMRLLERHVSDEGPGMPSPLAAEHVATALMAHWFASSDAIDRCYGTGISPRTCRGLDSSSVEPESIP